MTCRRHSHRPPALLAGVICVALLSACGPTGDQAGAPGTTGDQAGTTGGEDRHTTAAPDPGAPPPGLPAPVQLVAGDVLTPDLDRGALRLAPGEEATLRLPPPFQGAEPTLDEPAVAELVPVEHFDDPGYSEFQVVGLAPGVAALEVVTPEGEQIRFDVVVDED